MQLRPRSVLVKLIAATIKCLQRKNMNHEKTLQKHHSKLGLWLRLECSLDSLSIDSAHVIYVAEGHNVGAERQSSVMTLRKPIVTWII